MAERKKLKNYNCRNNERVEVVVFEKIIRIMEKWYETWKNWMATKNLEAPLCNLKLFFQKIFQFF